MGNLMFLLSVGRRLVGNYLVLPPSAFDQQKRGMGPGSGSSGQEEGYSCEIEPSANTYEDSDEYTVHADSRTPDPGSLSWSSQQVLTSGHT
jgi:hypothetical protein